MLHVEIGSDDRIRKIAVNESHLLLLFKALIKKNTPSKNKFIVINLGKNIISSNNTKVLIQISTIKNAKLAKLVNLNLPEEKSTNLGTALKFINESTTKRDIERLHM